MITKDNYEEYLLMHADGELQPHEEAALQAFLNEHPEFKETLALYEAVRLTPDPEMVYANKDALIKPAGRKIAFPIWRALSIAAGVAAMVVVAIVALRDNGDGTNKVVINKAVDTARVQPAPQVQPQEQVAQSSGEPGETASPYMQEKERKTNTQVNSPANHIKSGVNTVVVNNITPGNGSNQPVQIKTSTGLSLVAVGASAPNGLPVEDGAFNAVKNVSVQAPQVAIAETEERHWWIDALPITDEKKDKLNTLANSIAGSLDKADELKNEIKETKLSVTVEKRKLVLSF